MMFLIRLEIAGYEKHRKAALSGRKLPLLNPMALWWAIAKHFTSHQTISKHYLEACSMARDYKEVGLLSFSGFDKRWIWKKEWYDAIVLLPFECTEVACPRCYDEILRKQYGDYHVFKKGTAVHSMAVCDPEIPYKVRLKEIFAQRKNIGI